MDTTERTLELDKITLRFTQFIIAVNGTLIAYSFKLIENKELTLTLIPLGLAILFWGFSFYFGVTSIRKMISTRIVGLFKETDLVKNDTRNKELAKEKFQELGNKANRYNRVMYNFLYVGGLFFITWQLLEMGIRTFCK